MLSTSLSPSPNPTPADWLRQRDACSEGQDYALTQPTMAGVWDNCQRPDWMLWICRQLRLELDTKACRLFACAVVRSTPLADGRTTWDLLKDECSRKAVEVAERFVNGQATVEELREARNAAYAASASASAYAAYSASAYAAYAAYASASTSAYAYAAYAYAASTSAYAAASAYAASAYAAVTVVADEPSPARKKARSFQADELRKHISNPFKA